MSKIPWEIVIYVHVRVMDSEPEIEILQEWEEEMGILGKRKRMSNKKEIFLSTSVLWAWGK